MIARLQGRVIDRVDFPHHALITLLTGGIGYEVLVPQSDLVGTTLQSEIDLFTDFVVREDAMTLYGFESSARRSLFRVLQTVTGVGPKAALIILAATDSDQLVSAIIDGDLGYLESIPGVGKKVASRLSLELRDKMSLTSGKARSKTSTQREDLVAALVNLGYSEREANSALAGVDPEMDLGEALKQALSLLNRTRR